jgi:hypothetical protein
VWAVFRLGTMLVGTGFNLNLIFVLAVWIEACKKYGVVCATDYLLVYYYQYVKPFA